MVGVTTTGGAVLKVAALGSYHQSLPFSSLQRQPLLNVPYFTTALFTVDGSGAI